MTVLVLRLSGPMQSWGSTSRFTTRETRREPTKSGVIGLLAAALGRARTESLEDLISLRFGVRVEQPGVVMVDFQTAQDRGGSSMPLSHRHYLSDAVFLAALDGPASFLEELHTAVRNPGFPLFLGRRGYPATLPVSLGLREGSLEDVLNSEAWMASRWYTAKTSKDTGLATESLLALADAAPGQTGEPVRDVPLSFDPEHRRYAWREVVRWNVTVDNPSSPTSNPRPEGANATGPFDDEPDWLGATGGVDVSI